ncbi:MAG: ATP-binding protein [Eggerthellaceae bacterium]|nr:ATP-binding protein [Eggerthellaceae bacterium]
MKVAILSGKGGAGKTFTSVNLALSAESCVYADCDVEAPNGGLFLRPETPVSVQEVSVSTPRFDADLCTKCRACVDFCAFGALAFIGTPLLFDEICHACGGCMMVCPAGAVSEAPRGVGQVEEYGCSSINVIAGRMNIGESSGMPVIRSVLREASRLESASDLVILDCPPGTACSAAECVKSADLCIIVAEPSVYGAHNLRMAHDLVSFFGKPCGVVLNKSMPGENPSKEYCLSSGIPILADIPFDREVAAALAGGRPAVEESPSLRAVFRDLLQRIRKELGEDSGEYAAETEVSAR